MRKGRTNLQYVQEIRQTSTSHEDGMLQRFHGCRVCPYAGTKTCPHGVGTRVLSDDLVDSTGDVVLTKGATLDSYYDASGRRLGICPERVSQVKLFVKEASSQNGLRVMRAESLANLRETVVQIREKVKELGDDNILVSVQDDLGNKDVKLLDAYKQLYDMETKLLEKIEQSFASETKVSEVAVQKISVDQINDQLQKMKSIDVDVVNTTEDE